DPIGNRIRSGPAMRRNIGAKWPKSILEQAKERKTLMFSYKWRVGGHFAFKSGASAADLKSLTHALRNPVQGFQIESGARIMDFASVHNFPKSAKRYCSDVARTSESGH